MPVFLLNNDLIFPPVHLADEYGRIAVGGDLSIERLILAYRQGIFPWYSEGEPIIWYSPDPRLVLFPRDLHISKSMNKVLQKGEFKITFDRCFGDVMKACGKTYRLGQMGLTWITNDMLTAYKNLHKAGIAHSVEAWKNGELVGGLYGLSIGKCFFGESMFAYTSNASKVAFITLVQKLQEQDFKIIDCQVYTPHLASLGAIEMDREDFLELLAEGLSVDYEFHWDNVLE